MQRPTRATFSRVALLVLSCYFLLATSEGEDPSARSQQLEESLDLTIGSPAQIQFEQTVTGTDLQADLTVYYNVPGAGPNDVIVEVLGELPESSRVARDYLTCQSCGSTISVRFTLAPDADIEFGTVSLTASSELWAAEWSEVEGVEIDLIVGAVKEAEGLLVLAESDQAEGINSWEVAVSPNTQLEVPARSSELEVHGLAEDQLLVAPGERFELERCDGCPDGPIYIRSRVAWGAKWRILTTDPVASVRVRPLATSTAVVSANEADLSVRQGEVVRFTVVVSIDGAHGESDIPKPSVLFATDYVVELGDTRPRSSWMIADPLPGEDQLRPPMRITPTGWELAYVVEYKAGVRDADRFNAEIEAQIEWIDELTPLNSESIRIDVSR